MRRYVPRESQDIGLKTSWICIERLPSVRRILATTEDKSLLSTDTHIQEVRFSTENLAKHLCEFQKLTSKVETCVRRNHLAAAAAYTQVAANYASWNHTGVWRSELLENTLALVGSSISSVSGGSKRTTARNCNPRRILHVMTEAYGVGGHTRFVWRWMEMDSTRAHSLALTSQGRRDVPAPLAKSVAAAGGELYYLDRQGGGLQSHARHLRQLAGDFDLIVLHLHPFDVVPALAFLPKEERAPIIQVNHSDHLFWIGQSVPDVVANIRESGRELAITLRGLPAEQNGIIPIPLGTIQRKRSRSEAKKQLGLDENQVALCTIATKYKFEPIFGEVPFVDCVLPVLKEHRNAVLFVVGPNASGQWEKGVLHSEGRMRVCGSLPDPSLYFEAADIYLDPFPVGSLTSALEAGLYGAPVVCYCPFIREAAVLSPDSPGVSSEMVRCFDLEKYRRTLGDLIVDEARRTSIGKRMQVSVSASHIGVNWFGFVEDAYAQATRESSASVQRSSSAAPVRAEILDIRLSELHEKEGEHRDSNEVIRYHIGTFPLSYRLRLWITLFHGRLTLLPRVLMPEWARDSVRGFLRRCASRFSRLKLRNSI